MSISENIDRQFKCLPEITDYKSKFDWNESVNNKVTKASGEIMHQHDIELRRYWLGAIKIDN